MYRQIFTLSSYLFPFEIQQWLSEKEMLLEAEEKRRKEAEDLHQRR